MTSGLITSLTKKKKKKQLLSEWNHDIIFYIFNKTRCVKYSYYKRTEKYKQTKTFEENKALNALNNTNQ